MTQPRTPSGQMWNDSQAGDMTSGGWVSGIRRLTLPSEATIADTLAAGWLTEEEGRIIARMWMMGLDEAGDPETSYDAEKIMRMKWGDLKKKTAELPYPCQWVITQIVVSMSVNGRNFNRQQHMHTGYDSEVNLPTSETPRGRFRRRRRRNTSQEAA